MPLPPGGLDRTQQRILGCLLEKELAVPESYPLTENALLAACNQKSNRDPEMGLESFELKGALNAMMGSDWAKSSSVSGGRAVRFAHRLEEHFTVSEGEKAILCELLVRGPQAPGALKPRVARLGFNSDPAGIEAILRGMSERGMALVEMLEKRPRERDHRWRHRLGPMDPAHEAEAAPAAAAPPAQAAAPAAAPTPVPDQSELEGRVQALEDEVQRLRQMIVELEGRLA